MKIFKRIALIMAVAVAMLCMGVFASACDGNNSNEFTITVYYSDGTTAVDGTKDALKVQICDASGVFCHGDVPTIDAKGVVKFDIATVEAASTAANVSDKTYVIHVYSADYEPLTLKSEVKVNRESNNVKAILKDVAAPQK